MYNFDQIIERRGTNCVKWDSDFVTEQVTPMRIADMDFEVTPAIQRRLKEKLRMADV